MTEQPFEQPAPRRVYFGATDKQHLSNQKISGGPDLQTLEISRRQKLAMNLTQRAEEVAAAVKTLRAFDATGNTGAAIAHLRTTVADLTRAHEQLEADIETSLARYRDRRANQQVIAEVAAGRGVLVNHASIEADRAAFLEATRNGRGPGVEWPLTEAQAAKIRAGFVRGASIAAAEAPKPGPR